MNTSATPSVEAARPVIVVGAGPVGLSCAAFLARFDIPVLILERRTRRSTAPRAHAVNPRTLEIYRAFGLDVPRMIRASVSTFRGEDRDSIITERLTTRQLGVLPFEKHDDEFCPQPRINLAQPHLESILVDDVASLPNVELRVGHRVTALTDQGDRVVVEAIDETGAQHTIEADYVIACDGAKSAVRDLVGIQMAGDDDIQRCLTIHFEGSLRHLVGDRPAITYLTVATQPPGGFIAYDIDHTWSFVSYQAPEQTPNLEQARAIVIDAIGQEADIEIKQVVPWSMTGQVADRFRAGRVLLAGDAAHRFPPSGGLGLNTGVQDVHNLAWKIAAVRAGFADPALLDTYELERKAVAQLNTDASVANTGAAMKLLMLAPEASPTEIDEAVAGLFDNYNGLGTQLGFSYGPRGTAPRSVSEYDPRAEVGDRLPHAWCILAGNRASTLDLLDRSAFTLLAIEGSEGWASLPFVPGVPVTVRRLTGAMEIPASWYATAGLEHRGAILIRPDGHVLARANDDAVESVAALVRSLHEHLAGISLVDLTASGSLVGGAA